jgi:adenylate cyclase class 2
VAEETEIKLVLSDMEGFRAALRQLQPKLLSDRHFEDNFLLDFSDGQLRARACLVRVRKTKYGESVTFKGSPKASELFKSREELETSVDSADTMLAIFERMGMKVWFRYEKYREEYTVSGSGPGGEVRVAIDSTPIGSYAELEGSEEGIRALAAALGFDESRFLRDSYYSLYAQFCRVRGVPPGNMVFLHDHE